MAAYKGEVVANIGRARGQLRAWSETPASRGGMSVKSDVVNVDQLQPTVASELKELCGYKSGEVVTDHDAALGYVLERLPDALLSHAGLSPPQQPLQQQQEQQQQQQQQQPQRPQR